RAVQRVERLRNVGNTARLEHLHAYSKSLCRSFDLVELLRTRRRVPQDADACERGNGLDEELEAFRAEIRKIQKHASDVAARARETCDEANGHGIAFKIDGNDRSGRRGAACSLNGWRTRCDDDVDAVTDEFSRQGRQAG